MNYALGAEDERLVRPGDYLCEESWADHVRRTYPEAWAAARRRDEQAVRFYRAHPRMYVLLEHFPLWRRW